ncbi:FAD/NAD(P)-binding domain-containing protein [Schizophyllum commune H4-8]|nr:FAD/NAD(P)-binding domain-containing protein [Schizophyllum commune H4-8]KAI5892271.1 FAD/NAD(P)-binding domain-containing protein [Schizophyllum commune H4-8]
MSQLDVHIYEAASQFSQIGAGINIWGRVHQVFNDLGLEADLASLLRADDIGCEHWISLVARLHSPSVSDFTCRKSDQAEGKTFRDVYIENGRMMMLHRAEVQDLLLKHISPAIKIHLSHRLDDYSHNNQAAESIEMRFRGGQVAHCDLLIAADGVHSVVRPIFLSNLAEQLDKPELKDALAPVFSGSNVYRALVAPEQLEDVWQGHPVMKKPFIYCGKDKHVVAYPISCGRAINVVAFYTDMSKEDTPFEGSQIGQATTEQVLKTYEGWEPEVRAILSCMRDPSHWAIITQKPLDVWAADGVFLLGDSAHAMATHLGAGAGQAIEVSISCGSLFSTPLISHRTPTFSRESSRASRRRAPLQFSPPRPRHSTTGSDRRSPTSCPHARNFRTASTSSTRRALISGHCRRTRLS